MNKNAAKMAVVQSNLPEFGPFNSHFCQDKMFFISYFLHVKPVT